MTTARSTKRIDPVANQSSPNHLDGNDKITIKDIIDSDSDSVGLSPFSITINDPGYIYKTNIQLAKEGDIESQYEVYQSLLFCRDAAKNQEDHNLATSLLSTMGSVGSEIMAVMNEKFTRCKSLWVHVLENDDLINNSLKDTATFWRDTAASNDHVLAKAEVATLMFNESGFSHGEARNAVQDALLSGRSEAYHFASSYYANITGNSTYNEAWNIMSCYSNTACNTNEYVNELALNKPYDDYRRVEQAFIEIFSFIQSNRLQELPIFQNSDENTTFNLQLLHTLS